MRMEQVAQITCRATGEEVPFVGEEPLITAENEPQRKCRHLDSDERSKRDASAPVDRDARVGPALAMRNARTRPLRPLTDRHQDPFTPLRSSRTVPTSPRCVDR